MVLVWELTKSSKIVEIAICACDSRPMSAWMNFETWYFVLVSNEDDITKEVLRCAKMVSLIFIKAGRIGNNTTNANQYRTPVFPKIISGPSSNSLKVLNANGITIDPKMDMKI